jgi:hypothetical protein
MFEQSDTLLYVMSSDQQMTRQRYRAVYDTLHRRRLQGVAARPADTSRVRWETLNFMEALGHCETSRENDRWSVRVAPTVLTRLPLSGSPLAVLAGHRTPGTVVRLADVARNRGLVVEMETQAAATPLVPTRVTVRSPDGASLASFAEALSIAYQSEPAAWLCANASPNLDEYVANAAWATRQTLNWSHQFFDPATLVFELETRAEATFVLRRYWHPVQVRPVYELRKADGTRVHDVDPDWARYCVLRATDTPVLAYDARRFILAVPSAAPPPRLLARALSLCSGFAPVATSTCTITGLGARHSEYRLYRSVPPEVAGLVGQKLGQPLRPVTIDPNR